MSFPWQWLSLHGIQMLIQTIFDDKLIHTFYVTKSKKKNPLLLLFWLPLLFPSDVHSALIFFGLLQLH